VYWQTLFALQGYALVRAGEVVLDQTTVDTASGWFRYVALTFILLFAVAIAGFKILGANSLLPPPPLVGTPCIDVKLEFLRYSDLSEVNLAGVGSSATWRNLEMAPFLGDDRKVINAAPCHLRIHETSYYTNLLLELAPRIDTIIIVLAPRDFEHCEANTAEFMNTWLAKRYIRRQVPAWVPFLLNPRLGYILSQAQRRTSGDPSAEEAQSLGVLDEYGTSVMKEPVDWRPPIAINEACYAALGQLSSDLAARDVQLVVATIPTMPEWADMFDPDREKIAAWTERVEAELSATAIFLDGQNYQWEDEAFVDPVHLMPPYAQELSQLIAHKMQQEKPG
tara:strand:- start:3043 stop:4053 length:1011 start_codon:yes stop_codon:yes gene_type:complete